ATSGEVSRLTSNVRSPLAVPAVMTRREANAKLANPARAEEWSIRIMGPSGMCAGARSALADQKVGIVRDQGLTRIVERQGDREALADPDRRQGDEQAAAERQRPGTR